jgi:hypothetical protein
VVKGRGIFRERRVVDGDLEISASTPIDDVRLLEWIHESRTVLPLLQAMVRNGDRGPDRLIIALENLRRRVAALAQALARLRAGRAKV